MADAKFKPSRGLQAAGLEIVADVTLEAKATDATAQVLKSRRRIRTRRSSSSTRRIRGVPARRQKYGLKARSSARQRCRT